MSRLGPPASHLLNAAMGWLDLGNTDEAGRELARIAPELLDHPDVLEVRWSVCAATRSWETSLAIAQQLLAAAPDRSSGWIQRAYSLRRVPGGGLQQAWDALLPAFEKFPYVPTIPYNLACYAAQMDRLPEARDWIHKACEASGRIDVIKKMALADSDLKALWPEIRAWPSRGRN